MVLFDFIFNTIFYRFHMIFWLIFVTLPYQILGLIIPIFSWLGSALPNVLLFGSRDGEVALGTIKLPIPFVVFTMLSIGLFFVYLIFAIFKFLAEKNRNVSQSGFWVSIGKIIPIIILLALMPTIIFLFITITNSIFDIVRSSFGGNSAIEKDIFLSLRPPSFSDSAGEEIWKQRVEHFYLPMDLISYGKLEWGDGIFAILIPGFVGITLIYIFFGGGIALVIKVFQQFFLFIISPLVVVSMMADHGKRMNIWKQKFIGKTLSIMAFVFGIQLFALYMSLIYNFAQTIDIDFFSKTILMIFLTLGGALGIQTLTQEVVHFIGESASAKESLSQFQGGLATAKALAFGTKALATGGTAAIATGAGVIGKNIAKKGLEQALKQGKISKSEFASGSKNIKEMNSMAPGNKFQQFARGRSGLLGRIARTNDSIKAKNNPKYNEELQNYYDAINPKSPVTNLNAGLNNLRNIKGNSSRTNIGSKSPANVGINPTTPQISKPKTSSKPLKPKLNAIENPNTSSIQNKPSTPGTSRRKRGK